MSQIMISKVVQTTDRKSFNQESLIRKFQQSQSTKTLSWFFFLLPLFCLTVSLAEVCRIIGTKVALCTKLSKSDYFSVCVWKWHLQPFLKLISQWLKVEFELWHSKGKRTDVGTCRQCAGTVFPNGTTQGHPGKYKCRVMWQKVSGTIHMCLFIYEPVCLCKDVALILTQTSSTDILLTHVSPTEWPGQLLCCLTSGGRRQAGCGIMQEKVIWKLVISYKPAFAKLNWNSFIAWIHVLFSNIFCQ